ncbi:hypothetical protein [Leptolyngbya sp. FACHB-261]|uniref:hypothetical protein n=1 Tax=Leptolyngbya sp. FACHB-261 TaxID=2692806 RepID=UPI001684705E|nr:hypothetical protein [Leptolyngbya sp. FACHB-261]MBD2099389.1 hypothetical protein [Leptolyngbya sp. FACHB-261]
MLNLDRLIAVSPQRRSGVILCKQHHAEFAGPGAALGGFLDQGVNQVLLINDPQLIYLESRQERQAAYSRRIQWLHWLQKITNRQQPRLRAQQLIDSFEAFFGSVTVTEIPAEVLARLVGTSAKTIHELWEGKAVESSVCADYLPEFEPAFCRSLF